MIVNAAKSMHVIVELTQEDMKNILSGGTIYMKSGHYDDEPVLAEVYCSKPDSFDE